jgi:hypothetical protein
LHYFHAATPLDIFTMMPLAMISCFSLLMLPFRRQLFMFRDVFADAAFLRQRIDDYFHAAIFRRRRPIAFSAFAAISFSTLSCRPAFRHERHASCRAALAEAIAATYACRRLRFSSSFRFSFFAPPRRFSSPDAFDAITLSFLRHFGFRLMPPIFFSQFADTMFSILRMQRIRARRCCGAARARIARRSSVRHARCAAREARWRAACRATRRHATS